MAGPFTPMLFQGEEWAASTPFQFFTSHPEPELGRAVADGRIAEFERMGWDPAVVPDPQDPATYDRSNLDWSEPAGGRHAVVLDAYRRLALLRRTRPELTDPDLRTVSCTADEDRRLFTMRRGGLLVAVNVGDEPLSLDLGAGAHEVLFTTPSAAAVDGSALRLPPHAGAVVARA